MRFIIRPQQPTLNLLLETNRYQQLWRQHSRQILRAFREVTGLDFQQRHITARVFQDSENDSGGPHRPMHLSGACVSDEDKLMILVHELAHRLLGGNALLPAALGLDTGEGITTETIQLYHHQLIYLFLYDVVERALGERYAAVCTRFEEPTRSRHPEYKQAWQWAMSMSYSERQQAMQRLAAEKFTRERWGERDASYEPPARNSDAWFRYLRDSKES